MGSESPALRLLLQLFWVSPWHLFWAWWRCGSTFAFLAHLGALRFRERVALWDDQGALTFGQLHQLGEGLASALRLQHGVGPGAQVALMCGNHRGFVLGLLAVTRLGADVLPLSSNLPARVLATILERQKVSLVLHDGELRPGDYSGAVLDIGAWEGADGETLPRVSRPGQLVVLTSGSTGISKGIRRRPKFWQVLPLLLGLLRQLPFRMHRPMVLAIPLHHGYGIATLALSLALGAPLSMGRRYEIGPLLERIQGESALLVTVPTLLLRWLKNSSRIPKLAAIITGSAPLDASLCQQLLQRCGPILFNLYGSSEAGLVALATPTALQQAPGTVGRPLPANRVRLLDAEGNEVAVGETGRIWVSGPFVLGPNAEGWRDTGDLGRQDAAGHLFVVGRADSMFVSGGENVYPHEVEDVLAQHPSLTDFAILVVADAEFGQRMVAAVVARSTDPVSPEQLKEWLRARLERFKVPRQIEILSKIPRNLLGKLDRPALLEALGLGG